MIIALEAGLMPAADAGDSGGGSVCSLLAAILVEVRTASLATASLAVLGGIADANQPGAAVARCLAPVDWPRTEACIGSTTSHL